MGIKKAIFDYFLAQQKVIAQVGGSPDTGKKTKEQNQKTKNPQIQKPAGSSQEKS